MTDVLVKRGNLDTEMHLQGEKTPRPKLTEAKEPPESRREAWDSSSLWPLREPGPAARDHRLNSCGTVTIPESAEVTEYLV